MDKCANMLPDHTHTLSARVGVCVCLYVACFFAPLLSFTFLFYSIPLCFVCNSFALLRSAQLSSALRAFVCARPRATSNVVERARRQVGLVVVAGGVGEAGGSFYRVRVNWAMGGSGWRGEVLA